MTGALRVTLLYPGMLQLASQCHLPTFRPAAPALFAGYLYLRMGGGGQPGAAAGPGTAAAGGSSSGGLFTQHQQQQEEGFTGGLQRPGATGHASAFKGKAYKLGGS